MNALHPHTFDFYLLNGQLAKARFHSDGSVQIEGLDFTSRLFIHDLEALKDMFSTLELSAREISSEV
jgi:hypothetical protein